MDSNADTKSDRIAGALAQLDPSDDSHWEADGRPSVAAVRALSGDRRASRSAIEALSPDMRRPRELPGELAQVDEMIECCRAEMRDARKAEADAKQRYLEAERTLDEMIARRDQLCPPPSEAELLKQWQRAQFELRQKQAEAAAALLPADPRCELEKFEAERIRRAKMARQS